MGISQSQSGYAARYQQKTAASSGWFSSANPQVMNVMMGSGWFDVAIMVCIGYILLYLFTRVTGWGARYPQTNSVRAGRSIIMSVFTKPHRVILFVPRMLIAATVAVLSAAGWSIKQVVLLPKRLIQTVLHPLQSVKKFQSLFIRRRQAFRAKKRDLVDLLEKPTTLADCNAPGMPGSEWDYLAHTRPTDSSQPYGLTAVDYMPEKYHSMEAPTTICADEPNSSLRWYISTLLLDSPTKSKSIDPTLKRSLFPRANETIVQILTQSLADENQNMFAIRRLSVGFKGQWYSGGRAVLKLTPVFHSGDSKDVHMCEKCSIWYMCAIQDEPGRYNFRNACGLMNLKMYWTETMC